MEHHPEIKTDLLDDLHEEPVLEHATKGQRFANYLIDYFLIVILCACMMIFMGEFWEKNSILTTIIIAFPYYFIMEVATRGRTLGKFITRTRAVNENGEDMSLGQVLGRTLSRLVPFDNFSGLGTAPWHDKWSGTIVIKA
ncbi:RDD family protein [Chitinophaga vietnamensis]|uniref:RDD family protein n=1 Tax=Chitinophaga vietnamensis TaxID=2593957 RepID=UPI001177DB58|nr:RDD family protein [Chitinophaga vietnamensis]